MKRSERLDVVQQVTSRTERERAERVGAAERHLVEMQQNIKERVSQQDSVRALAQLFAEADA